MDRSTRRQKYENYYEIQKAALTIFKMVYNPMRIEKVENMTLKYRSNTLIFSWTITKQVLLLKTISTAYIKNIQEDYGFIKIIELQKRNGLLLFKLQKNESVASVLLLWLINYFHY